MPFGMQDRLARRIYYKLAQFGQAMASATSTLIAIGASAGLFYRYLLNSVRPF